MILNGNKPIKLSGFSPMSFWHNASHFFVEFPFEKKNIQPTARPTGTIHWNENDKFNYSTKFSRLYFLQFSVNKVSWFKFKII